MGLKPHICVVIPAYNHGLTVARVAREAAAWSDVIGVDDGSTDETAEALADQPGVTLVRLERNQGKGAALRAGFAKAEERGFTHAITMDADGQHSGEALEKFGELCRSHPDALIIGSRDLKGAGAPCLRRWLNTASNWCFRIETGRRLPDTQCGFRCYPLALLCRLSVTSGRYAFELEALVKAAWAGAPVLAFPIAVDYTAPTSRISHFRPAADLWQIASLHARLLWHRLRARPKP
jgi:glycosyltransferase involved in cell wall biosynthesis